MKNNMQFVKHLAVLLAVALFGIGIASAQTNLPDPSSIYTSLYTPFSAALTWVISATAVLMVIRWIRKAVTR